MTMFRHLNQCALRVKILLKDYIQSCLAAILDLSKLGIVFHTFDSIKTSYMLWGIFFE